MEQTSDQKTQNLTYSSDEEDLDRGLEILVNSTVEVNDLDSKENDYLIVGSHGNGSAFVKSALYLELKANKTLKVKFMTQFEKNKNKPKRLVAELYQIRNNTNSANNLVLLTKEVLDHRSYRFIADYITSGTNLTIKRAVVFDSCHISDLITFESQTREGLYCLMNKAQIKTNQLVQAENYPGPNTIKGFCAYLLVNSEVKKIPCIVYISAINDYEVGLKSVRTFERVGSTYAFLREKLTDTYFKENNIALTNLPFKEYNTFKNNFYL